MTQLADALRDVYGVCLATAVMDCVETLNTQQPYGHAAHTPGDRHGPWAVCNIPRSSFMLWMQEHRKGYKVGISVGDRFLGESAGPLPMEEARKHMARLLRPA